MSKYSHLSDAELFGMYKKNLPQYRTLLSKLTSLLKTFFGRTFSAFAADVIIDVNSEDGREAAGGALHVSEFKTPNEKKLRAYVEALDLADSLDFLQETYDRLRRSSVAELKKQAPEIKRTLDALSLSYNKALDAMTEIANKTIPDTVGELFKASEKALDKVNAEGAADVFIYVGAEETKGVHFVQTLDVSHWERENNTPILAVIITVVMAENSGGGFDLRVYVNVHDRAVLPFRYNLGTEIVGINVKAIASKFQKEIEHALAVHKVVAVIAPAELKGVDDVAVTSMLEEIKGVSGVNVFEDSIEVEIPGGNRDTIAHVVRALNGYAPLKKMIQQHYSPSFADQGDGIYRYTITRKA